MWPIINFLWGNENGPPSGLKGTIRKKKLLYDCHVMSHYFYHWFYSTQRNFLCQKQGKKDVNIGKETTFSKSIRNTNIYIDDLRTNAKL